LCSGTGLVISRLAPEQGGGWSAPSAIGTVGLSWGAVIGIDVTDYVVILNTSEAVTAFSGAGQISIGAGVEVAIGPVGRSGSADFHVADTGLAPAFSYSHSRGLFAGLSLDGSVIMARSEVNHCFYGRPVTPMELLQGSVPPPRAAAPLYAALDEALSSLPDVQHVKRVSKPHQQHLQGSAASSNPNSTTRASVLGQQFSSLPVESRCTGSSGSGGDAAPAKADGDGDVNSSIIDTINSLLNSSGLSSVGKEDESINISSTAFIDGVSSTDGVRQEKERTGLWNERHSYSSHYQQQNNSGTEFVVSGSGDWLSADSSSIAVLSHQESAAGERGEPQCAQGQPAAAGGLTVGATGCEQYEDVLGGSINNSRLCTIGL
jgi:hypothetical protein